tara:strand:- start:8506 stop:8793 length:288 start_codon:yes stop_codon:yes gene_type:complete
MAEEPKHILDVLLEKISNELENPDINIFLAVNEDGDEFLAIKTEGFEKGLEISQVINSYAGYRFYQCDTEEEAMSRLSESLAQSIKNMVSEALSK